MKKLDSNFACRCDNKEGAECDEVLAWAKEFVNHDESSSMDFVTRVVMALEWRYRAHISFMGADQWCGINTKSHEDGLGTFIQCDRIEDGLAYTLRKFYDEYGDERK